jgi:uncharacterized protein YndB with AHSA1/START domain
MSRGLVARQSVRINAPPAKVWDALINPAAIKKYMFGTTAVSHWKPGSSITFKGEWQGKPYEDHGAILRLEPERVLEYTHFSPLSGLPDRPENYHTVTFELSAAGNDATVLTLSQDNNTSEQAREHAEKNWGVMLADLKKLLE